MACFKIGILLVAMLNCMMPLVSAQSPKDLYKLKSYCLMMIVATM